MGNESLSFELKLVDSVTSVAKRQAAAVKSVETSANKAQLALGKQFEKVGFAAARAAHRQEQAFAASWAKIGMAAQRAQERQKKEHERMAEKAKEHSLLGGMKEGIGFGRLTSAAFLGGALAEGALKIGETLIESAHKVVEVIVDGFKDVFKAAGKEQTQRISEKNVLGIGARGFREDADRFAKMTAFDDADIRKMMLPLRRAGIGQAASRQAFATAADIGGSDPAAVGGIIDQFKKIYTKQGIGKRQLVELLGNVGTTIPDFYKSIAKKMHISVKEAEKKSEDGGLDPQMIMNMITEAQNKKQGGRAGTGALEYAKLLEVRWKKIIDLPHEYFKVLVDSPGFARASEMLGSLLDKLNPESPTGKRIMTSLESAFDKITNAIGGGEDGLDGIVDSIENVIALVADLIPDLKMMGAMLISSTETIADIVRGARVAIAITSGDKAGAVKIIQEQQIAQGERMVRKFSEQNEEKENRAKTATTLLSLMPGNPLGLYVPREERRHHRGDTTINVTVQDDGDSGNPDRHGRKIGNAIERARQHWGN